MKREPQAGSYLLHIYIIYSTHNYTEFNTVVVDGIML